VQQLMQLEIEGWRALLDRNADTFSGLLQGARIGLLSKDDFEPPAAMMVVWEASKNGMQANYEAFPGFEKVKIDLLLIADDAAIRRLHDADTPAPFTEIKSKVRRREILLYVVKPRHELLDWGYEDFLDALGLAFMGACR
jgi:hypothetical protein